MSSRVKSPIGAQMRSAHYTLHQSDITDKVLATTQSFLFNSIKYISNGALDIGLYSNIFMVAYNIPLRHHIRMSQQVMSGYEV